MKLFIAISDKEYMDDLLSRAGITDKMIKETLIGKFPFFWQKKYKGFKEAGHFHVFMLSMPFSEFVKSYTKLKVFLEQLAAGTIHLDSLKDVEDTYREFQWSKDHMDQLEANDQLSRIVLFDEEGD